MVIDSGNSVEKIIQSHYEPYKKLPKAKRDTLLNYSIQYMFKGISAAQFTKNFRDTIGDKNFRVIEMRRTFSSTGYFLKNLKLWLYYWYINKPNYSEAKKFGLLGTDRLVVKRLNEKTLKMFEGFKKKKLKAKTIEQFERAIVFVVESEKCKSFISKMVYRKMRFIYEPHGMEADDICKELLYGGIEAAMFTYPNITSGEHLTNIITRTAHNDGMNFINRYTTQRRGRIRQNSDGKRDSRIVVPIDSPEAHDYLNAEHNASDENEKLTTQITVSNLLKKYNGKQRYFLNLVGGNFDPKFSEWLQRETPYKKDNEQLATTIDFNKYVLLVANFLGVKEKSCLRLIDEVREKLAA